MTLTLRQRITLLFLPALALLLGIGGAGVWLLDDLGRRADAIARENVVSLRAMFALRQAMTDMERVTLWAVRDGDRFHPDKPRAFREAAGAARAACRVELDNITVPGEREKAELLARCVELAVARGEALLAAPAGERWDRYIDPDHGFQHAAELTWSMTEGVWALNEDAVYAADRAARDTARRSTLGLAAAVGVSLAVTAFLSWRLRRAVLGPIRAVTDAAAAIGGGQLHLVVPEQTRDELGRLAGAFNAMTRKLRELRQTDTARLLRARLTGQATIDSFPDPVVVVDTLGRVEISNPAAEQLLGVRPPRDGDPPAAWTPPDPLRPTVEDALRRHRAVETAAFDQAVTFRLGGEDRVYLPQARPIRSPDGEPLGAAVVLTDVTRFRLLDRLKSDWVATVSHELKTPLTGVRLAVHVLLEELVGPLGPKQVELLVEARENAERLAKLIEHLLALARLEDGREPLDARPTDPAALLRAAADDAAAGAGDRRVELVVEDAPGLPPVAVDAARLGRALGNLLDNAVAHTPPGGRVTLAASPAAGGRVRLTVADTGVGIPPEYLPHVFDRFFRVPGRDGPPGTGLGLAIVREVVAAHGGEVACESEPGRGTAFHITLPAREGGA